jgi:hypothetical protein
MGDLMPETWTLNVTREGEAPSTYDLSRAEMRAVMWNFLHGTGEVDVEAALAQDAAALAA